MLVNHRYIEQGLYTPENATALLVGTFPSILIRQAKGDVIRQRDVDFYYGSADNLFWKDLAIIYNRPLLFEWGNKAVQQRKQLLSDQGLAITDIIASCETAGGAADHAITVKATNTGILTLLDNHPTITTLFFTSGSGVNGAEQLTMRMLTNNKRISKIKIIQKTNPKIRSFLFHTSTGATRPMQAITLYSPSPLAKRAGITDDIRRKQYAEYLPKLGNV